MAYKNKEDQAKNHKKWYDANKEYKRIINKRYKKIKKEMIISFKQTQKCPLCGENYHRCLDFHHVGDETKDSTINDLLHRNVGLKKIIDEMNKCCIICSNCHRKLHDGLVEEPIEFKFNLDYDIWNIEYKKELVKAKHELEEIKRAMLV